ncbi:MAG TPA: hypothetical protein VKT27_02030 [Candidatus Binataceae bacterium]|nr:hypothetical protein [Candidatus Binataceae bacterium]
MDHEVEMERDQREDRRRQEEDMKGEEAAERRAAEGIAAEQKARKVLTDERRASDHLGRQHGRPHRGLIPAQQLPAETHRDGDEQQAHAADPVELPRVLVTAHQENLDHVDADQQDHRRGAEEVHPAQEIAEHRLVGDELEHLVGRSR